MPAITSWASDRAARPARRQPHRRRVAAACGALLLLALPALGGCAPHVSTAIDDAALIMRVKTALLNDPRVGALRIEVDASRGVVTLSGRVPSEEDVRRAVGLARTVAGVVDVQSTLQIDPGAG